MSTCPKHLKFCILPPSVRGGEFYFCHLLWAKLVVSTSMCNFFNIYVIKPHCDLSLVSTLIAKCSDFDRHQLTSLDWVTLLFHPLDLNLSMWHCQCTIWQGPLLTFGFEVTCAVFLLQPSSLPTFMCPWWTAPTPLQLLMTGEEQPKSTAPTSTFSVQYHLMNCNPLKCLFPLLSKFTSSKGCEILSLKMNSIKV